MVTRTSGTVTKALDIMDHFLEAGGELSVSQLSLLTGIHKSTIARLCATMGGRGYLRQGANGRYRLGPRIEQLAGAYREQFRLEEAVRPVLRRLRDETTESASFYVREGDVRVCLFRENARHAIRHHVEEGARKSLREGVVGRVLLAFAGEPGAEYDAIRRRRHLDAEGREPFTASVSVPVTAGDGVLVGALVVSGLSSRFSPENRRRALELLEGAAAGLAGVLPKGLGAQGLK